MAETQGKQQGKKSIARNRSARHEYEIGETFECGLVLTGTEVKSLRERGCQLTDTFLPHSRRRGVDSRHAPASVHKRWRVER